MQQTERTIEVDVPVTRAYNQWTQFEEFPRFMEGVESVRQIDDATQHWVAEIAGRRKEWDAKITEQVPDQVIAWEGFGEADNRGRVFFEPLGETRTKISVAIDYEPSGPIERVGDALGVVDRRIQGDLDRFKELIESAETGSDGWRGEIHDQPTGGDPATAE